MFGIGRQILAEEGVGGLFRGASMRMLFLFVGGSAFFGIYERARVALDKQLPKEIEVDGPTAIGCGVLATAGFFATAATLL